MKDKDCKLCHLEHVKRPINVTVNPATLCYRHQPAWTHPQQRQAHRSDAADEGDG